MENNFYYNNDVCIVGVGCVLPEANNPQEFWKNITKGHCSIRKMPEARFSSDLYLDKTGEFEDKVYSNEAAFVESGIFNGTENNTRLSLLALEATKQAIACLKDKSLDKYKKKTAVFLGCMSIDETLNLQKLYIHNKESLEKYIEGSYLKNKDKIIRDMRNYFCGHTSSKEELIASTIANYTTGFVKKQFDISGQGCLVDAACASSMAALDISVEALKNYETDTVITGGVESNLDPGTFVLFGKVGALSKGAGRPFDKDTDGLSQGEGAVIFILQRMEDAIRDKNRIYGVIKSIGSSSDGRSSSLFSPSSTGQVLALEKAYAGIDKTLIDYIECHGTGTKVGDGIEVKALNEFFSGSRIPIGSVKALIGHTKGAAGAAGVLKCILSMEVKIIPASPYINNSIAPDDGAVYINKKNITVSGDKKTSMRFGISSFGFGNINYHVVLDEFRKDYSIHKRVAHEASADKEMVVIIGRGQALLNKFNEEDIIEKFKIPPRGIEQTDKTQLLSLKAVADAFERSNIEIDMLDKNKVVVISASTLCLDAAIDFDERVRHFELKKALPFLSGDDLGFIIRHKEKFPKITEDTSSGILNNVISGKICNTFDFKGKNFNIDSDFNSASIAMDVIQRELRKEESAVVILVFFDEKLNEKYMRIERGDATCLIFSTLNYALEKNFPIRETLKKINYHD